MAASKRHIIQDQISSHTKTNRFITCGPDTISEDRRGTIKIQETKTNKKKRKKNKR